MTTAIIEVPFRGDVIEATQDDRGVWVPLRRPCGALGLAPNNQIEKLKGKPWAVGTMIISHDDSGRRQEMYALHLDSLPMWLATINPSRVRKEVRPKLELYQKEAARTLADWFFGRKNAPGLEEKVSALEQGQAEILQALRQAILAPLPRLDQLVTVEERCRRRWPQADPDHRRRVRDVAIGIYRERFGQHPFKLTGHKNGVIAFEREHLDVLDQAIDVVMEEVEGRQVVPLFLRPPTRN